MTTKKIDFNPPKALLDMVGEGIEAGQFIELMTTFQVKDNGNWCVVSWEGVPAPGYKDGGKPESEDDDYAGRGQFRDTYMHEMGT